jgi:transposase InsO family protein
MRHSRAGALVSAIDSSRRHPREGAPVSGMESSRRHPREGARVSAIEPSRRHPRAAPAFAGVTGDPGARSVRCDAGSARMRCGRVGFGAGALRATLDARSLRARTGADSRGRCGGVGPQHERRQPAATTTVTWLATAPNQVWSWDITKLKGPAKWTCFHLYVILDIFSRLVVGYLPARERRRHARHPAGHTGRRVPGAPQSVQEQKPATARLAHRSMDQPATTGETPRPYATTLHSKFMMPGVAKSLTRSGRRSALSGRHRAVPQT